MISHVVRCVLVLSVATGTSAASAPSPNLLFQLQKQNHAQPWLRVTTDSSRRTLRALRIDEAGIGGLTFRERGSPAPDRIAWRSITRIDELCTRAKTGRISGFVVGGAVGMALGSAIGASMGHRQTSTDPSLNDNSDRGHGGVGMALGLVLLGGLGAWQGGRFGERFVTERPWYAAAPEAASSPNSLDTTAVRPQSPLIATPSVAQDPANTGQSRASPAAAVLRACARIHPSDLIVIRGDFGRFEGYASVVGPEGIEGLRATRDGGGVSPPTGRVAWDRIEQLDRRGNGWRKGALVGSLLVGAYGGVLGYMEGTQGLFEVHSPRPSVEVAGITLGGIAYGATVGAVIGAGVGCLFPAWHRVYTGRAVSGTGP